MKANRYASRIYFVDKSKRPILGLILESDRPDIFTRVLTGNSEQPFDIPNVHIARITPNVEKFRRVVQ